MANGQLEKAILRRTVLAALDNYDALTEVGDVRNAHEVAFGVLQAMTNLPLNKEYLLDIRPRIFPKS